jgi:streptogramin lyase
VGRWFLPVLACAGLAGSQPHLVARVDTGLSPGGAAATAKAVWVANDRAGTLTRIDPRTNRVTKRIRLRPGVFSVATGFGHVWVVNYKRGSLTRIDPRTGSRKTIRIGAVPFDVLTAYGRVWVTAWEAGQLVELDPSPVRVVRRIAVGSRPTGLAASHGTIWVGFGRRATAIARVSPRTGGIERIPVGVRAPSWFAAGTRGLWIQAADNVLVHVDPASRRVLRRVSFGRMLAQGALGPDGRLWVPDKEQSLVYRVDPASGRVVDSFAAGPGAFFALRALGSMWVTSYAGRDVWRFG